MTADEAGRLRAALRTLTLHDTSSRAAFDQRSTVRAWQRTEQRRRIHFDEDLAAIADLIEGDT